ncbi:hypothetical protein H2198_008895 [Neophaeococcomyces mojaviensis]|uniref:Uncharacterized protein n=1 Tax=Neophaeococcomyces mojaviensis TaxID=3383035 RepID=A0ACC2ZWJ2_9EURO|nr:hypothetical protein H2198_008895 [Knufia sp. JES_112]
MYRNTASSYVMHNSLPSPEYTGDSDSDSDIIKELEQKRRELDEEVARFRAQKDKEFRDFELELKSRRKQKRSQQQQGQRSNSYYEFTKSSPSKTPPHNSMLSGCEKHARKNGTHHARQSSGSIQLMKPKAGLKVTTPTISLDPTNIRGETIPQSHALHTPPTPTTIFSTTSEKATNSIDQPSHREKPPVSSGKPYGDAFAGIFVPVYLPLLDSINDRRTRPLEGTQTEPASPTDRLTSESMPVQASSLPTESSISEGFHIITNKRAYTSPSIVNRTTLPPIIRNVNGRKRSSGKRKHVTFQLADRAIVAPSSSYKQGSSPEIDDKDSTDSLRSTTPEKEAPQPAASRPSTSLDPFGRRKRNIKPDETSPDEIGMGMGDLLLSGDGEAEFSSPKSNNTARRPSADEEPEEGYFSPKHGITSMHSILSKTLTPESPSPENPDSFNRVDDNAYIHRRRDQIKQRRAERRNSRNPPLSPSPLRASTPITSLVQPTSSRHLSYPGSLANSIDATTNVGFFELDEELASPDAGAPRPYGTAAGEEVEAATSKSSRRRKEDRGFSGDMVTGTSVPIDIVKPGMTSVSNSWIGTFGH